MEMPHSPAIRRALSRNGCCVPKISK